MRIVEDGTTLLPLFKEITLKMHFHTYSQQNMLSF